MTGPRFAAPQSAPKRPDLTFLARRTRRTAEPAQPAASAQPAAPAQPGTPQPGPARPGGTPQSSSLDLTRPASHHQSAPASSLDLTRPPPREASAPASSLDLSAPASPGSSLDLSAPASPAAPAAPAGLASASTGGSLLDLSAQPAAAPSAPSAPAPAVPQRLTLPTRRLGQRLVLDWAGTPVVRLNRLQAGVGALQIEARCSEQVDPLRLGCVWRTQDSATGVLSRPPEAGSVVLAPPGGRPLLAAHRSAYEALTVDLRQVRRIDTLLLYASAPPSGAGAWAGTLSITTLAGSQVDVPMDAAPSDGHLPLVSIRQVDGHLYVRALRRRPVATLRDLCTELGFAAAMTWLDADTPA